MVRPIGQASRPGQGVLGLPAPGACRAGRARPVWSSKSFFRPRLASEHQAVAIKEGPNKGDYCDGAWGTNPPLTPLIDYSIDELWLVEFFPKERKSMPMTPAERKERKDELWQNSLVDHELYIIEKVNEWLASGRLNNEDGKYRHIKLKKMPMLLDLPAGAAFVNSPSFIQDMMVYGYDHAKIFLTDKAPAKNFEQKFIEEANL